MVASLDCKSSNDKLHIMSRALLITHRCIWCVCAPCQLKSWIQNMISKFMWNCVLNTISKCCVYGVHSTVCNKNFPYVKAFILQEAKSRHNTLINIQSYLFSPLYCTKAQAPLWLLMQQLHRFKRQYWWLLCKHKGELPSLVRTNSTL